MSNPENEKDDDDEEFDLGDLDWDDDEADRKQYKFMLLVSAQTALSAKAKQFRFEPIAEGLWEQLRLSNKWIDIAETEPIEADTTEEFLAYCHDVATGKEKVLLHDRPVIKNIEFYSNNFGEGVKFTLL